MADDIVTRLREYRIPKHATLRERPIVCHEAADEIERLRRALKAAHDYNLMMYGKTVIVRD